MVRGEQVDWAAPTPHADDPVAAYQENAQALRAAWAEHPDAQPGADWQCAEIAVHTWDLGRHWADPPTPSTPRSPSAAERS